MFLTVCLVINFEKQIDRSHIENKQSYEGAASKFHLLYNTEKSAKKTGNFQEAKVSNWDNQRPRDNAVYNISETFNLRQEDF